MTHLHSPIQSESGILKTAENKRFVYLNGGAAKLESADKSLAEKAMERKERMEEPLNAETRFSPNPEKNIQMLAQEAYPGNKAEQERYGQKIKASLEAHLKEGQSMESLWKYLKENICQTSAIIEGILRFFAGVKGEKEISIAQFLKPIEIRAESNLHETLREERQKEISKTKSDLMALLAEIQGNASTQA